MGLRVDETFSEVLRLLERARMTGDDRASFIRIQTFVRQHGDGTTAMVLAAFKLRRKYAKRIEEARVARERALDSMARERAGITSTQAATRRAANLKLLIAEAEDLGI